MTESQFDQTTVLGSVATNSTTTKRRKSSNSDGKPVSDLGEWRRGTVPEPEDWDFENVFGAPPDDQATWDPEEFDPESELGKNFRCASPDSIGDDQRGENTESDSVPAHVLNEEQSDETATVPQGHQPSDAGDTTPSQADGLSTAHQGSNNTGQARLSSSTKTGRKRGGKFGARTIVPWRQQRSGDCQYISERERNALKEGSADNVGSAGKRSTRARVEKYTR